MTFFLNDYDPAKVQPRRGPDLRPTGLLTGIGATTSTMMRDTNANFLRQREVIRERDGTATQAAERLGMDKIRPLLEERNRRATESGMASQLVDIPDDPAEAARLLGPNGSKAILDLAREQAKASPDAWKDLDLTDEGVEARVTARRVAEDEDEAQIRALMPSYGGLADLIGGVIGAAADVRNIPFMFGGGGGSFLKVIGREAMLGAAAETVTLPSQFATAKELDKPDPSVPEALAFGAIGGAVLGGAAEGVSRGLAYYRGRQATPPGPNPAIREAAVGAAEDAMVAGENPLRAVQEIMRLEPLVLNNPLPREPLIPGPVPGGVAPITTESLPSLPGQPRTIAEVVQQTEEAVASATLDETVRGEDPQPPRRKGPKPQSLKDFVTKSGGIWKGDDRGDLKALEYRRPGFLKNSRIVRSTAGDNGGGRTLDEMREAAAEAGYLPVNSTVNDFIDLLTEDIRGTRRIYAEADMRAADEIQAQERMAEEATRPADDFIAGARAEGGFFVDRDAYDFDGGTGDAGIAQDFAAYLERDWPNVRFTEAEKAEMLGELQQRGGEAEFLVERVLEREADYFDRPASEADDYGTYDPEEYARYLDQAGGVPGAGGEGLGRPEQDAIAARGGPAGAGRDLGTERTAAGEQYLAPGIAPITTRQRLEQQQNAPLGGGVREADSQIGGLFDPGAKARMDLFDDPTGPKARVVQDAMAADMRDKIEVEDFTVDLGEGPRSVSSLLDELEGDDEFGAILDACGKPRVTE